MDTKKRKEINSFKEGLQNKGYSELNSEAIALAFGLMKTNPDSWQHELKTNRKHSAIMELMYEIKNNKD